jgi:hypothetical protein
VYDDRLIVLLGLLELEGDCDSIAKSQEGIAEAGSALVADELEVSQAKPFGASFALDGQVLAGSHGKEECAGRLSGPSSLRHSS